jgi:hypothetical protein
MSSLAEKLNLVREAEEKARDIRVYYDHMAREAIAKAHQDAQAIKEAEEAKARERGEKAMRKIIEQAKEEAEELRIEYFYDRLRLREVVVKRRRDAIDFLVRKLLELA